jgi:hypothetical protein
LKDVNSGFSEKETIESPPTSLVGDAPVVGGFAPSATPPIAMGIITRISLMCHLKVKVVIM